MISCFFDAFIASQTGNLTANESQLVILFISKNKLQYTVIANASVYRLYI
jgi:hypothetical protein